MQVIADSHGNVVHLGERNVRFKGDIKTVRRSTVTGAGADERDRIGKIAAEATRKMGYLGVGTMEFL